MPARRSNAFRAGGVLGHGRVVLLALVWLNGAGLPPVLAQGLAEPCPPGLSIVDGDCRDLSRQTVGRGLKEGYADLIQSAQVVAAIGDDLLGESVNLYTGATQFRATDTQLPGNNALPVAFARRFQAESRGGAWSRFALGDWDLDVPYMRGVFERSRGWQVSTAMPNARCSSPANVTAARPPHFSVTGYGAIRSEDYWSGYQLYTPEGGEQEWLFATADSTPRPTDAATYKWLTKQFWYASCLSGLASGDPGEGFLVRAPNGDRYHFNWMVRLPHPGLILPRSDGSDHLLERDEIRLYPTRIEDVHGNWVDYTWVQNRLTQIRGSDGRQIDIGYNGGRVSSVNDGSRTWTYQYSAFGSLTTVTQPDASTWVYDLAAVASAAPNYSTQQEWVPTSWGGYWRSVHDQAVACSWMPVLLAGSVSGSITHPSGATGVFEFETVRHGRTFVEADCNAYTGGGQFPEQSQGELFHNQYPVRFDVLALRSKRITGPGLSPYLWNYQYGTPIGGYANACSGCPSTKTTTVMAPDGSRTVFTYGVRYQHNEGQLLSAELLAGATRLQLTSTQYVSSADAAAQPFNERIGVNPQYRQDTFASERLRPAKGTIVERDGVQFSRQVNSFDVYAEPVSVTRSSTLGFSKTEITSYHHHTGRWVIGQVASVQDQASGRYLVERQFHPVTAQVTTSREFGSRFRSYTYHHSGAQNGALASITDGRNHTTSLGDYHRGVPRSIGYPTGASLSAVVGNLGTLSSVTDAMGYTTQYGYDAMGRLSQITHPAGDPVTWLPTTFQFERVQSAEYGLPAGHWRRTEATGNARTITYFDALWRPVLSRTYDHGDEAGTRRMVQRRFDHAGRETFASYPLRSIASVTASVDGVHTQYDALGRVTQTQTASEIGTLGTQTVYLDGFRSRHTNARNHTLTVHYQAFDAPDMDAPVRIEFPGGAVTTIARDRWGKPTSITREGTWQGAPLSLIRRYVYDAEQRLCKRIDPESGSTVLDYDGADNIAWSSTGLNLGSSTDCQRGSVAAGERSTHSYDPLNRLTHVQHPAGAAAISYGYYADGALHTVSSAGSTWTYNYNRRRLLTTETLVLDGVSRSFSHRYNSHGQRDRLSYPDGSALDYLPNALGEPRQVGSFASNVSYHPDGSLAGFTYGNGIAHSTIQNLRLLPQRRRDAFGSTVFVDHAYTYDANGNVASITDGAGGIENRTLSYDALDRLTQSSSPNLFGIETFTYDPLDNLRQVTIGGAGGLNLSYRHNAQNRMDRITFSDGSGSATRDYAYDARGNATQRGGVGHSFDRANRMVAGAGESHRYDGHGRRVHTIRADGARSSQLYGLSGQLLQESGTGGQPGCAPAADRIYCHGFDPPGSTEVTTRYVHLGGRLIAQVSGNSIAYVHTDRLGSVAMLTGPARQVLRQTRYAPYGSTTNGVYVQGPGYTGHVTDAASQLHYMQQRYYDPVAMRFVSVDPVNVDPGTGGNFNRYAYANNNPYRYIDPDGRQACPTGAAICYEAPSTKQGPAQPAISDSQRTRDSHVAAARSSGRLSDGTQLDLRREEQSFRVDNVGTAGGIDEVQGCVTCNGRPVRTMAFSYPPDSSPGHTHGEGIEQLPGRDDASRAAQTGQTAYMISKTRAFAIEHTPIGYRVRIVNGPRLSVSEMREMEKKIETWNTNHGTGGGSCTPGC